MSRTKPLLLCLLALGLAGSLGFAVAAPARSASAAVDHPLVGIGDDKPDMLGDPRFLALGITAVRYDMAWDALSVPYQRAEVTAWMDAAHRDGLDVLVTIDHSDRVLYRRVKVHGRTIRRAVSQTRVMPATAGIDDFDCYAIKAAIASTNAMAASRAASTCARFTVAAGPVS